MEKLTDAQLVSLFKDGDNKAFEAIVMRYQVHTYNYALAIVKNPDAASDVVQDLFVKVFKNLPRYNEENKLKNWIFTLARNVTMDYFRKNSKKMVPLESQNEDEVSILETLPDDSPQPLETAITNSEKRILNQALLRLSTEERELIYLKDSMTFQEIADMQHKPIGTLLSKFNRSLKKLRKILAEIDPEAYDANLRSSSFVSLRRG